MDGGTEVHWVYRVRISYHAALGKGRWRRTRRVMAGCRATARGTGAEAVTDMLGTTFSDFVAKRARFANTRPEAFELWLRKQPVGRRLPGFGGSSEELSVITECMDSTCSMCCSVGACLKRDSLSAGAHFGDGVGRAGDGVAMVANT
jgi:hypothetical protein